MSTKHYDSQEIGYSEPVGSSDRNQVLSIIIGPVALLVSLTTKYALSQQWACKSNIGVIAVHVVAIAAIAVAVGSALLARSQWSAAGREVPGDHDGSDGRRRTLSAIGFGLSLLSALFILAQWLPQFVLDPCAQ